MTDPPPVLDYHNPWEDPPDGCLAVIERHGDGITIRMGPMSPWVYAGDFLGLALLAALFLWLLADFCTELWGGARFRDSWLLFAGITLFLIMIAESFLRLWTRSTRGTTISVRAGRLTITRPRLVGDATNSWPIAAVVTVTAMVGGMSLTAIYFGSIQIWIRGARCVRALHRRRYVEVKWIVQVLNRTLAQQRGDSHG